MFVAGLFLYGTVFFLCWPQQKQKFPNNIFDVFFFFFQTIISLMFGYFVVFFRVCAQFQMKKQPMKIGRSTVLPAILEFSILTYQHTKFQHVIWLEILFFSSCCVVATAVYCAVLCCAVCNLAATYEYVLYCTAVQCLFVVFTLLS